MAKADSSNVDAFPVSDVNGLRRRHERGYYDKKTVYEILDAALVCHIAYVIDRRPFCTPTCFWREGDHLYWHGSSASRMIRTLTEEVPVCLTVTHVDSLVLARSGFHHSINYRSAMVFGHAHLVEDADEKLRLMDNFIDRIYPKRSELIRPPKPQEAKATAIMAMAIDTASAKIRDKHVADDEEDYATVPAWSALYPITQLLGSPSECPRQMPGLRQPDDMADYAPGARFDEVLRKAHRRTFG